MKLIKNFKINLRHGYILRDLRKLKIEVSEDDVISKSDELQKIFKSGTLYDSFKPEIFRDYSDFGKSVTVTLFAVTLGVEVEKLEKDAITEAALKDGLEVGKTFALKLIEMEAENEDCELTDSAEIEPQKIFENEKVLKTIDFSKIDIKFEAGILSPVYTKFYCVGWLPKKKK